MQKTSLTRLAIFAVVVVQVLTTPPNIGQGNYMYDPNSIPQNEKILKLFVRLAAHTANRLIRLKIQANNPQLTGYEDDVEMGLEQSPDLNNDKIVSPIPEVSEVEFIEPSEGVREINHAHISGHRNMVEDEGNDKKPYISIDRTIANDIQEKNYSDHKIVQNQLEDLSKNKTRLGMVESTTEIRNEVRNYSDDLDVEHDLEDTESSQDNRDFPSREPFLADEDVDYVPDYSDQKSIPADLPTRVNDVSQTPAPEGKETGVELENRALFNFEKNNYLTQYTDQSTNINRADTTVNNNGVSQPGRVFVNQEAGSKHFHWDRNDTVSNNLGSGSEMGGKTLAGDVVVNQVAGSTGFSGMNGFDQSINQNQASTMIGNSGNENSASLDVHKNLGIDFNRENMESMKKSAAVNAEHYNRLSGQMIGSNLQGVFAHAAAEDLQKNQNSGTSSLELRKEVTLQLIPGNLQSQNSNFEVQNSAVSKERLGANFGSNFIQESQFGVHHGENDAAGIFRDKMNTQMMDTHESKLQESMAANKRQQEIHSFSLRHDTHNQEHNHHSLSKENAFAASSVNQGQFQAGFEKSAHSSSQGNSLGEARHVHESALKAGGEIGLNLQHGSISENNRAEDLKRIQGSLSAAANVQAGGMLKVGASKGLSAELGMFNTKLNLGGFEGKANFGGKLNLAAQVIAS